MSREPGYYWVYYNDSWAVAEWENNSWWTCGSGYFKDDSEFEEIGERIEYHPPQSAQRNRITANDVLSSLLPIGAQPSPQQQPDTFDPHLVCAPKKTRDLQKLKDKLEVGQPDELSKAFVPRSDSAKAEEIVRLFGEVSKAQERVKELDGAIESAIEYLNRWESTGNQEYIKRVMYTLKQAR